MTELSSWLNDDSALDLPDHDAIMARAKKALAQFRFTFNEEEIVALIEAVTDEYRRIEQRYKKMSLRAFFEPGSRPIKEAYDQLCDDRLLYRAAFSEFFKSVSESQRGRRALSLLSETLPHNVLRLARTVNMELLPLLREQREYEASFQALLEELSLSGTRPATVKGEVRHLLQSPSRDHRMRAYLSLSGRMAAQRQEAEAQFLALHELRRNIGQKAGFSTYHDYVVAKNGLLEKDRADIHKFRHLIEKHMVPLAAPIRQAQWERIKINDPAPWDALYMAIPGVPTLFEEAFPLEDTYLEALNYIFHSKLPFFDAMRRDGALSFHVTGAEGHLNSHQNICTHDAMAGVNSAYFPEIEQSFLLLSSVPQEWLCRILFSETGALLVDQSSDRYECWSKEAADRDLLRQYARHAMVILSQRAWGMFYGHMTRYAREYALVEWALELPLYCALDEMEEFICRARVSNLAVFRHAWSEIAARYSLEGSAPNNPGLMPVDDLWLFSPLWWTKPLMGINQALAKIAVLGSLPFGRYHQRLEEYFTRLLTHEGNETVLRRIEGAGFPSPFDEETVQKAAFSIVDFLGL